MSAASSSVPSLSQPLGKGWDSSGWATARPDGARHRPDPRLAPVSRNSQHFATRPDLTARLVLLPCVSSAPGFAKDKRRCTVADVRLVVVPLSA